MGNKKVYFSGDTVRISEKRALPDIDIALVTINLPYTMLPEKVAGWVKDFGPSIVNTYYYRGSELQQFNQPPESHPDIEVRIRECYEGKPLQSEEIVVLLRPS